LILLALFTTENTDLIINYLKHSDITASLITSTDAIKGIIRILQNIESGQRESWEASLMNKHLLTVKCHYKNKA